MFFVGNPCVDDSMGLGARPHPAARTAAATAAQKALFLGAKLEFQLSRDERRDELVHARA